MSAPRTRELLFVTPSSEIDFPVRVLVHLPVRGVLYRYCVAANAKIREVTESEITFEAHSFQIPHVTLVRGTVPSKRSLENLLDSISKAVEKIRKFDVTLSRPYVKGPSNHWIFIDVDSDGRIQVATRRITSLLAARLDAGFSVSESSEPHVTVGYVDSAAKRLVASALVEFDLPSAGRVDSIAVSFAGRRGSCLGIIREFELRDGHG